MRRAALDVLDVLDVLKTVVKDAREDFHHGEASGCDCYVLPPILPNKGFVYH